MSTLLLKREIKQIDEATFTLKSTLQNTQLENIDLLINLNQIYSQFSIEKKVKFYSSNVDEILLPVAILKHLHTKVIPGIQKTLKDFITNSGNSYPGIMDCFSEYCKSGKIIIETINGENNNLTNNNLIVQQKEENKFFLNIDKDYQLIITDHFEILLTIFYDLNKKNVGEMDGNLTTLILKAIDIKSVLLQKEGIEFKKNKFKLLKEFINEKGFISLSKFVNASEKLKQALQNVFIFINWESVVNLKGYCKRFTSNIECKPLNANAIDLLQSFIVPGLAKTLINIMEDEVGREVVLDTFTKIVIVLIDEENAKDYSSMDCYDIFITKGQQMCNIFVKYNFSEMMNNNIAFPISKLKIKWEELL
ncbi:hypothetical protein ABK040_015901 [Willaertia magna]